MFDYQYEDFDDDYPYAGLYLAMLDPYYDDYDEDEQESDKE